MLHIACCLIKQDVEYYAVMLYLFSINNLAVTDAATAETILTVVPHLWGMETD